MAEYFVTTRKIKGRGSRRYFGQDIGEPSFVVASDGAQTIQPLDREIGAGKRTRWGKKIIAEAKAKWANAARNAGHIVPDDTDLYQGDIVVLIHGFNIDAKEAFGMHQDVARNLREQGLDHAIFVSYSWPSDGEVFNYWEDDADARETAIHLVKSALAIFAQLSTPDCRVKVHVMAHSMGSLVVREALRAAPGAKVTRDGAWGITNLITYAADISVRSIRRSDGDMLIDKSQRYTNYFNRADGVLATSNAKRFATARRLGRHGVPENRLDEIVDVDVTARWEAVEDDHPGAIRGIAASHSFYHRDPVFGRDVALTILGEIDRRRIETRDKHDEEGRFKMKAQRP